MRGFTVLVLAAACAVAVVGCSDIVSPTAVENDGSKPNAGHVAAGTDVFIAIGDIDGESKALEEAMDVYSGVGAETAALLVPAIQKVREVMAELEEGANRDGTIDAHDATKKFKKMINTHKPDGRAYSIKDIFNTSAAKGKDGKHVDEIPIESYKNNDAANVEYQLMHVFTGVRMILDDAGVNDDAIDSAIDGALAAIADLSDERP